MKTVLISEAKLDEILDSASNPPKISEEFTETDFYGEWKDAQSRLKEALLTLGYRSWNDGGEDYTMADDWGLSRSHDVEIHTESMWSDMRVLPVIQQVLAGFEPSYQVVVHHDLFLRGETAMCHFVIQKNETLVQTDDPQLLKRLRLEG